VPEAATLTETEALEAGTRAGARLFAVSPWAAVGAALVLLLVLLTVLEGPEAAGQATVNGVIAGTYFALGAVGLTLVFGVLRLVNFAHGDLLTLGAYVAFLFNVTLGVPIVAAAAFGLMATAVLAVISERVIWKPMRRKQAGAFQLLLITIGLAFVIRETIQLFAGAGPRSFDVDTTTGFDLVGGVRIGKTELIVVVVGLAALVGVAAFLRSSRVGKEMRALSDNLSLAETSGIDTASVISITWLVAGAMAGLAGVLSVAAVGVMTPNFGFLMLLSLFAAAVLGGIGNPYGALAGGLVLGLVEEWSTLFVDPRWKLAVGFTILIATLLLRPNGLFGQPSLR
jgi:neutral amino acid transport system permease protein